MFTLPLATALAWVREGRITDSKTVSSLFWAEKVLAAGWGSIIRPMPQSIPPAGRSAVPGQGRCSCQGMANRE